MWRNDSDQKYQLCYSIAFCLGALLTARGVPVVHAPGVPAGGRGARACCAGACTCLPTSRWGRAHASAGVRACVRAARRLQAAGVPLKALSLASTQWRCVFHRFHFEIYVTPPHIAHTTGTLSCLLVACWTLSSITNKAVRGREVW
jgi:hypothetical protein